MFANRRVAVVEEDRRAAEMRLVFYCSFKSIACSAEEPKGRFIGFENDCLNLGARYQPARQFERRHPNSGVVML